MPIACAVTCRLSLLGGSGSSSAQPGAAPSECVSYSSDHLVDRSGETACASSSVRGCDHVHYKVVLRSADPGNVVLVTHQPETSGSTTLEPLPDPLRRLFRDLLDGV